MHRKKASSALITCYGWVGFSTSVINTAKYWAQKEYSVDLYVSSINKKIPLPEFHEKNIKIIHSNKARHKFFFIDDVFFNLFYFKKKYNYIIGFDARGLVRAFVSNIFGNAKLIYHSLEFLEPDSSFYPNFLKKTEMFCAKYAVKIFSQDELRINYLMDDLKLPREKFDIVYNSPIGFIQEEKKHYFNDFFSIPYYKKIVLVTGSLIKEHCIKEIIDSVRTWDDSFVLVLHGIFPDKQFEEYILAKILEMPGKVFLSTHLFNDSEKYLIFQSVDIGFVGFRPINNNLKLASMAAGKLYNYMQCGVPIIGYALPGMYEIVEKNKIGFVFENFHNIDIKLNDIIKQYEQLRRNCFQIFNSFEFTHQYNRIFNIISYEQN